ncbi:MAG: response regulator [Nitrospinae bacterium]|nr:response regulator [Nitrospinota bacterium]
MSSQLNNALVLLVDDTESNLELLEMIYGMEGAKTLRAASGLEALRLVEKHKEDIDLIVTDIRMPEMDGITLTRKVREIVNQRVPVILLTADRKTDEQLIAGLAAGANDYLNKPVNELELKARSSSMLRLKHAFDENIALQKSLEIKVVERTVEIEQTRDLAMFGFAKLAEHRDPETGGHLERIREYTRALAVQLRKNGSYRDMVDNAFIMTIQRASPLHDIGKVGIPDAILLKPGRLTAEEFEVMKQHSVIGGWTLEESEKRLTVNSSFLHMAKEIAYCHHEKWDGNGYPANLKGEEIPLAARIMALADVYDALISKRIYKPPIPHAETHRIIMQGIGTHFDPAVVEAYQAIEQDFINILSRFKD